MPTKPAPKKATVTRSNKPNIAKARQSPLVKSVTEMMHKLLDDIIFSDMPADERRQQIDLFLTNVGNGVEFGKKAGGDLRAGKDVDPNKLIDVFGKAKAEPLVRGHVLRPVQYPELLSFAHIMDDEKVVLSFKTEAGEKTITIEGPVEYNLNVPGHIGCGCSAPSLLARYQPDFGGGQITIQTAYGSFGPFHFARRLTSRVLWFAAEIEAMLAKKAGE